MECAMATRTVDKAIVESTEAKGSLIMPAPGGLGGEKDNEVSRPSSQLPVLPML